jgi:hypothetical protein
MSPVIQFDGLGTAPAQKVGDGRSASRRRILKAGIVAFNDRHSTLPCTVRDLSTTGARLRVNGSVNAPDTFELIIELDGLEASCQVVWRKVDQIGVRFLSAPRIVAARRIQVVNAVVPQTASLRRKPNP